MKTVRRVVLRKGGKYVTIVTYGLLGFTSRYTTKAVSHVSSLLERCIQSMKKFLATPLLPDYLKMSLLTIFSAVLFDKHTKVPKGYF